MLRWQLRYLIAGLIVATLTPIFVAAGAFGGHLRDWAFPPATETVRVARVVDGDTFVARVGGAATRVRLIGVDTPETVKPHTPVQCFGEAASRQSKHRLSGATVKLTYDVERHDRYGRTLAYVDIHGEDYSAWLLEHGYGRPLAIEPNTARADSYDRLATRAQKQNRGLWRACGR